MSYQAPHYRTDPKYVIPGVYLVIFHPGHTVTKHFEFLDRKFDLSTFPPDKGYHATIDDQLLAAIRRDPGVRFVEDDATVEEH